MEAHRTDPIDRGPITSRRRIVMVGGEDLNLRRLRRQIYSLLPLATRAPPHTRRPRAEANSDDTQSRRSFQYMGSVLPPPRHAFGKPRRKDHASLCMERVWCKSHLGGGFLALPGSTRLLGQHESIEEPARPPLRRWARPGTATVGRGPSRPRRSPGRCVPSSSGSDSLHSITATWCENCVVQ